MPARDRMEGRRGEGVALVRSVYRVHLAQLAERLGLDPGRCLASSPGVCGDGRYSAMPRRLAVYMTVVGIDVRPARLAEALGVSRAAITKMLHRVEDMRDDPRIDRMLEEYERVMGRGAGDG